MEDARILDLIIEESGLPRPGVLQTIALLNEGGTVPFIARYRKEQTGELDEVQIRTIQDLLAYHRELAERKGTVLKSIEEQGKLTPELKSRIDSCRKKTELEDLYLPYKPKRRTKATIAKERGLEPLADLVQAQELISGNPEEAALPFVNEELGVPNPAAALEGAAHIIAERLSEDADARAMVRRLTWEQGSFASSVLAQEQDKEGKYQMYYEYCEPIRTIPSHRMLAMRRGEKETILKLVLDAPEEEILAGLKRRLIKGTSIFNALLEAVAVDAYRRLIAPSIEVELRLEAKNKADEAAIEVFAQNLRHLLLAAPAGQRRVLGVDPGLRTGCKLAALDETGRFLEHTTIYPHTGGGKADAAAADLIRMVRQHDCKLIAIGNGTAGRETEVFVAAELRKAGLQAQVVMVSEAGASVYSASDIAREEFPELDLTVRGAISIGRRLQDPLAELVKIDPKSIGVGQYQHDVNQSLLKKSLDAVVESCVNYVGVDLNSASWALLSYVAGLSESQGRSIVRHRDENGAFPSRKALHKVPRFGAKAFEQAAGFLRIRGGENPLDNTAVHPENYAVVEAMAADLGKSVAELVAQPELSTGIKLERYVSEQAGLPTLRDILGELKKPGRDPRDEFKTATFREDITTIADLKEGMILQGVVTNVAAFGAFVDIGVHQDGLVHVSQLAHRFIKDPSEAVKVGEIVKVKVLAADPQRKRIALSIKQAEPAPQQKGAQQQKTPPPPKEKLSEKAAWEKAGFRVK
ncbi:Tex family protein [Geomesophilobacter sediminis]|uniref:RNA-binding transcriptional accessory protein n=1 Tax=Geomesophilobacter sediminis TaxID=2798584 RepID=A0A8J7IMT5_9BACT|nr:Tex family protein [Geomesophilobacter sediminis]MBJ6724218.1 RNA-binding transcriptional accessory protein [Geomesophilobacter sediminis]